MKTFRINILRVFKESSHIIREKLIRLIETAGSKNKSLTLNKLMTKIGWKFVVLSLHSYKKATSRFRLYHKFCVYLLVMTRRHGAEFTVKYLKACNLAVSKYLAGEPFLSLREIEPDLPLPRLSKSGLPVIIGTRDRRSLSSNSLSIIRLYLSLFSLYRIISIPGTLKISTITDPFSGDLLSLSNVENWMRKHSSSALQDFIKKVDYKVMDKFLISEKTSPTCSKSWTGMVIDTCLLKAQPSILVSLLKVMETTCSLELQNFFKNLLILSPNVQDQRCESLVSTGGKNAFLLSTHDPDLDSDSAFPNPFVNEFVIKQKVGLGQLSEKLEAAGKVRVFAMVDSWTQTACHSLHNYLMDILKCIPNDGSADHGAAFVRATHKAVKYNCCYGYDLSAATDRLPLSLQIKIIQSLFGNDFGIQWGNLLAGRVYHLVQKENNELNITQSVKYAVGQPMGAKSSWTMLALTHHMLMQYCAKLVNPILQQWEERYEIVGDDIVIFSEDLANAYLKVMKDIGVPINASKSVVSKDRAVCEFVKRISVNGKEVTPLSWKQFLSQDNFLGRINTVIGLFLKEKEFFGNKAMSVFHTVLKDKSFDTRPFKDSLALISLYSTYALKTKVTMEMMLQMLYLASPSVENKILTFKSFDIYQIGKKVKDMILTGKPEEDRNFRVNSSIIFEKSEERLCKKLYNCYQGLKYDKVREAHKRIVMTILNGLDLSNQWDKDLYDLIYEFFSKIQDPMSGYPELAQVPVQNRILGRFDHLMKLDLGMFSRVPLNTGVTNKNISKLAEDFVTSSDFGDCKVNLFGGTIKVIPKGTLSSLNCAAELLTSWEGKLSFLRLVDRLQDKKVEELRGISDTALLSEFVKSLELAKADDRWSEGSKKMKMMNMSFSFDPFKGKGRFGF